MTLAGFFFYLFAVVMIASAIMVISVRNPVHAVLFLILTFFNAAGLMLMTGAEFIALLLVIVYVGAVAVLFLFVVMMLDIDFVALRRGFMEYLPLGALIGLVLMSELLIVVGARAFGSSVPAARSNPLPAGVSNTEALGRILYTDYSKSKGQPLLNSVNILAEILAHRVSNWSRS